MPYLSGTLTFGLVFYCFRSGPFCAAGWNEQVVEISGYIMVLSSEVQLPGTASDYASDSARAEFTAGVASALNIEASAVRSLTFATSRRLRRRQLLSHEMFEQVLTMQLQGQRRQLQTGGAGSSSVSASYEVVTSNPAAAADLLAATADSATFTERLVTELNSAGDTLPTLDTTQVAVADPLIS